MASNFDSEKYLNVDWKTAKEVNSTHYDRLGLDPGRPYTPAEVEEAYDHRYNWWTERKQQKDTVPNNPLIQKVGEHIKTAIDNLLLAKNCLSDAEKKCVYDNEILAKLAQEKEGPFLHNVAGALLDHELSQSEKAGLFERARELGITRERAQILIWEQLKETGSREVDEPTSTGSGAKVDGGRRKPESDPPELTIDKTSLPLGTLRRGDKREAIFTIDNRGGGILQGHFTTSHPHWLNVSPSAIIERRHHQEVKVTVDTSKLALGASYTGEVIVHSNGGTQPITVQFSIEIEKAALARFRQGLFWLGFCGGGVLGYYFYHFLPSSPSRDVISGIAGLLGIIAAMVVGGRSAGFGGGCAGLILSLAVLGALQKTWPEGFSTLTWAITYGAYLHTVSRPFFVGKQTTKAGSILAVAAGGILLLLGTIACGYYFSGKVLPLHIPPTANIATVRPSFNCAKARKPTEMLICRDSNLATSELAMVAAYNNVFAQLPMEQKGVFQREHVAWFKDYARTCDASPTDDARRDCIASHLSDHTQQLQARLSKLETDNNLTGQAGPNTVPVPGSTPPGGVVGGTLTVRGPPEVEVLIDGVSKASTDAQGILVVTGLPGGSHTIHVRKNGYLDRQSSLAISTGQNVTFPVDLQLAVGNLTVRTLPDAEVSIDGSERGRADAHGYLAVNDLPAGTHQVVIRKPGYSENRFAVELASGETQNVSGLLDRAEGFLSIHADPPGTIINIAGVEEFSGDWSDNPCPAATYTITASHLGMKTETRIVVVGPGQHASVEFRLSPDPTYSRNMPGGGTPSGPVGVSQPLLSDVRTSAPPSLLASTYLRSHALAQFQTAATEVLREGGSVTIELMHEHSGLSGDSAHPATVTVTPTTITYGPGRWSCKYSRFSAPMGSIEAAEVSNRVVEGKVIGVVVRHLVPGTFLLHLEVRDPAKSNAMVKLYMATADSYIVKQADHVNYLASQSNSAEVLGAVVHVIRQASAPGH